MEELLNKIIAKREQVQHFISKQGPRNRRMLNIAIVCGILGTGLAGIPAIGGQETIDTLKAATNPGIPVWQILCIGAALSTMAATLATTVMTNHDSANKLSKAQVSKAKLEMLELLIKSDQIEQKQAIEKYGEYAADVAFIPET
jgi:arginine exporter protein ArgO